ncbi:DUF934 domain-containing protein [Salipiger mucosus]|uniref:Oxidoreductase probably involved in sulfite reduction n=1 Tax=Salipiger mucosus DSM 16094 TaxID=1123237 RepID=S9RBM1_9RHOB|nr:DUF934 domain-containing protein [Salipiger mucosus]EPX75515.1 Oxidoreductase probably involved in sulfite reduction [Salipiger mucosus DSM 16094]
MSVIVTDTGFGPDDWTGSFEGDRALELASDTDPAALEVGPGVEMICIEFPSFSDGRGFTLARLLRLRGYTGRLRARGHVISDQYAMARRSGFDEVEISDELAARQPEDEWKFRANWQQNDYQSRLRG